MKHKNDHFGIKMANHRQNGHKSQEWAIGNPMADHMAILAPYRHSKHHNATLIVIMPTSGPKLEKKKTIQKGQLQPS